jgi:hypothetical protein
MAETAFVEDVLAPSCKIEGCPNEAEAPTDGRLLAQWAGRHLAKDEKQADTNFAGKTTGASQSLLE